jgi:HEXXH motif-containing protein
MTGYHDLTIPEEGSTSAREVLSRALGVLLDDFRGLDQGLAAAGPGRNAFVALRGAVARSIKSDPGAVFSALRRPTVGVLIRCLRIRRPGDVAATSMVDALTSTFAMELARAGTLEVPIGCIAPTRIPCLSGRFVLDVPEDADDLVFANHEVTLTIDREKETYDLDDDGGPFSHPYHHIDDDLVLALFDNNPIALEEAHPDKDGNALSLGGQSVDVWISRLRVALDLIGEFLPTLRAELALFLQQVVPVGYDERTHLSASYQEAIGTVYLTLHPHPMTMAEALIHEMSHNKLNALFERESVLDNAFTPLFASPVRPDPRPLHGVLLAVHAFLPVARLYERLIEAGHPFAADRGFLRRYRDIVEKNTEAAETLLAHGRFTNAGEPLAQEIRAWDRHFRRA